MKIAQAQSPTSSRWLHPTRLNLDCFVCYQTRSDAQTGKSSLRPARNDVRGGNGLPRRRCRPHSDEEQKEHQPTTTPTSIPPSLIPPHKKNLLRDFCLLTFVYFVLYSKD